MYVVLEARLLCGSAFCLIGIGVPDNALGVVPLGFVEDKVLNFHAAIYTSVYGLCMYMYHSL